VPPTGDGRTATHPCRTPLPCQVHRGVCWCTGGCGAGARARRLVRRPAGRAGAIGRWPKPSVPSP